MIFPRDAIATSGQPLLTAPTVSSELDNFFHEVPSPNHIAIWFHCVHSCTKCREVDSIRTDRRGGEDRLLAIDLFNNGSRLAVQDIIVASRRTHVQMLADNSGCRHVVAVPRTAGRLESPAYLKGRRVDGEDNTRAVNDVHGAVTNDRRSVDAVCDRDRGKEAQRVGQRCFRGVAGTQSISLQLWPISSGRDTFDSTNGDES